MDHFRAGNLYASVFAHAGNFCGKLAAQLAG
jgi:hypothetical protein